MTFGYTAGSSITLKYRFRMPSQARNASGKLKRLIAEEIDELGIQPHVQVIEDVLMHGTSADRQLRVFDANDGDIKAVVDHLIEETKLGIR